MVSAGCEEEWKNLVPELLLGLVGCGGGAFVYTAMEDTPSCDEINKTEYSGLVLSDVVDWVSDAEREQFNRLAKLGWYYHRLSEYATSACRVDLTKGSLPYHAAVGQGVLEVLDVYRQAVLKIEGCLLETTGGEGLWSLLPLEHALAEFFQLFPFLDKSIKYICAGGEDRCRSRDIIHVFEKAGHSGIPIVDGCALRIAWHCYQVMLKQIYVWMVRGTVVDPTGDFFIHMEEDEGQHHGGLYGVVQEGRSSKYVAADVVEARLPTSISPSLARDILNVGQCARFLASLSRGSSEEESEFAMSLNAVSTSRQENIDWIHFKHLVHAQKVHLSERVWKEMHSEERNLQGHIGDLVDALLQNRGSLYREVLLQLAPFVSSTPNPQRAADIASHVFKEAALLDEFDDAHLELGSLASPWKRVGDTFSMTWYDVANVECVLPVWHPCYDETIFIPSYDAWDGLCMRYDVKWPMHLIFPAPSIRVYGAMWQLMFRLARCLDRLKSVRPLIYTIRKSDRLKRFDGADRRIRTLYHHLYHLLSTYADHLHTEIVARSNDELRDILGSSSSLIDAESKHMKFVTEMVEISCMDTRQVMGVIENMFSCVTSLASLVEKGGSMTTKEHDQSFNEIYNYFWSKYNVLYQLLQSGRLQSGQRGEAIRRLLLKLNYNGFLDTNAAKQLITHQLHIT